ncbi:MAG: response regulator [Oscillatoriales cyanobacterium]|nr:MAG: response regulator [Oscillatoriales cyanobacterium]TAH23278.1 MAG: response regulator [Oscillatoriales cyanobacterium]
MNYPNWNQDSEYLSGNSDQLLLNKRPLVLAVDDNQDNLELLAQILDLFGCECVGAVDGGTALTAAASRPPDLILLDICLPDIDGIELVSRLKQNLQLINIPIIAITALAKTEDRDRILQAGCVAYLSKPFDIDQLEAMMHQHLN